MSRPEDEFSPYYLFEGPAPGSQSASLDLGSLLATYQSPRLSRREGRILFLTGLAVALAPGAYGMGISYQSLNRFGAAAAQAWSQPWFTFSAVLLILLAFVWIWILIRSRGAVLVYKNGLALRKALHKPLSLRWREIAGISFAQEKTYLLGRAFTLSRGVLHPNQGKPVILNGCCKRGDLPEVVTRLKASLYQRLEPELRSSLKAGQRLYFGPLGLSQEGVQIHNRSIPWSQVSRVSVQSGKLLIDMVGQDKDRIRLPVSQIQNVELFLRLSELACALGQQTHQPVQAGQVSTERPSVATPTHPSTTS